jgi:hypothetical protein
VIPGLKFCDCQQVPHATSAKVCTLVMNVDQVLQVHWKGMDSTVRRVLHDEEDSRVIERADILIGRSCAKKLEVCVYSWRLSVVGNFSVLEADKVTFVYCVARK